MLIFSQTEGLSFVTYTVLGQSLPLIMEMDLICILLVFLALQFKDTVKSLFSFCRVSCNILKMIHSAFT